MQSSVIDKSNKCYNCDNKINSLSFEICHDCDNIFCDICCEDIFIIRYCNTGSQSGPKAVCCSCVDFDNINQCENCYFWDENMVLFSCSQCEKLICKDCIIEEIKKDCKQCEYCKKFCLKKDNLFCEDCAFYHLGFTECGDCSDSHSDFIYCDDCEELHKCFSE